MGLIWKRIVRAWNRWRFSGQRFSAADADKIRSNAKTRL